MDWPPIFNNATLSARLDHRRITAHSARQASLPVLAVIWLGIGLAGAAALPVALGENGPTVLLASAGLACLSALPWLWLPAPLALLAAVLGYLAFAFSLTLGVQATTALDARTSLAVFKNVVLLAIIARLAWPQEGTGWAPPPGRKPKQLRMLEWLLATLFTVLLLAASATPLMPRMGYALNTYLPLGLFFIALPCIHSQAAHSEYAERSAWLNTLTLLFLITVPLGLIVSHYLISPETLILQQAAKGYDHINGYPRNWWSEIGGDLYLRLTGTAEDPILYGYLAGFLAYVALIRGRLVAAGILLTVLTASLVKGALLMVIGAWTLAGLFRLLLMPPGRCALGVALMSMVIAVYVFGSEVVRTSANAHVLGLWLPFEQALKGEVPPQELLIGHGPGSSGNLFKASLDGELAWREWLSGGAESGFGLLFYQTGIVGAGLVLWLIVCGFARLHKPASLGLWTMYWANSAVQENLINLNYLALLLACLMLLESLPATEAAKSGGRSL